jgi:hypothetical protein
LHVCPRIDPVQYIKLELPKSKASNGQLPDLKNLVRGGFKAP